MSILDSFLLSVTNLHHRRALEAFRRLVDVLVYQVPDVKEQEVVRASRRQDDHRYITDRGHSLVISTSTSVYSVISANEIHILAPGKPVVNSTFLRNLATGNDAPEDQFQGTLQSTR